MKDSLSHYDETIPDGMSWDEMVGGIEAKIPAKKRRFGPFLLWFGIGLLVTGSVAAGYKYIQTSSQHLVEYGSTNYTKEKQSQEKIDRESITPTETSNATATATEKQLSTETATGVLTEITKSEGRSNEVQTRSSDEKQINITNRSQTEQIAITVIDGTEIGAESNESNINSSKQLIENKTELAQEVPNRTSEVRNFVSFGSNQENGDAVENTENLSNVDKQSSQNLGGSFAQSLALSFFDWTMRPETLPYKEFPIIPAKKENNVTPLVLSYYIALDAGVTFWDWNQENNADFNISDFEREQLSYNSHLIFGMNLGKSFALESGLSFHSLESEFNNAFVEISKEHGEHDVYNVITQEYQTLAGEVIVRKTRTVRNFNSIKQFSVPLIAIYRLKYGKFGAGVGAGPELRIANMTSGRTINKMGEFVDYSENSTLSQAIGLGAVARVELAYDLYDKLSIYSSFRYKGSITDWTNSSEIARNPNLFSIGLGIRKTF